MSQRQHSYIHFGTPVPQIPCRFRVGVTQEELIAAIHRHCRLTSERNLETLRAADPATRESILSSPHLPSIVRESLRQAIGGK